MADYQHILFATDFSDQSEFVGKRAFSLAKLCKAKLSIAHVLQPLPMALYGGSENTVPMELAEEVASQEAEAKKQLIKQGHQFGVSEKDCWLKLGSTEHELLELIKKLKVDAVVVGSHDKHGLALLISSTADTLLHNMLCDVLAVHIKA